MAAVAPALTYIDAPRLEQALLAGIARVQGRRDHLNRINVFPVPDGDTGTNLAFTLASVRTALGSPGARSLSEVMARVAEAALDGARGNSGAILAQYFHGVSEGCRDYQVLDGQRLATVARAGARSAWQAMADPVPGTLPTVLEDFGRELSERVESGTRDIRALFGQGLKRARVSLADTPRQLAVLREAGVVDAGAQGFVDLLEGIWHYMRSGRLPEAGTVQIAHAAAGPARAAPQTHRYCTECLIEGQDLEIEPLRAELADLDASSLAVAGGGRRARVHLHTDRPGEVFRICARFGVIRQQKADDMTRQHGLLNQRGRVAVVTDSAADLPAEEADRLGIHVIPVRLFFGETEYLDKLSMTPAAFYRKLAASAIHPQTSQPPPADFRRQFDLLTSHGHEVLALHLSAKLSGTLQAAEQAAGMTDGRVSVFDTRNAACGQALMVLFAAEAAARGWELEAIIAALEELTPATRTYALARDLSWGVRGGRVKPWMEWLASTLRLNPVLANSLDGRLAVRGVVPGRRHAVERFGRWLLRRMKPRRVYRILISHTDAIADARRLRDQLLTGHPEVDACWVEEASPAVGAHAGPGSLIVGLQAYRAPEQRNG